ncbi:MAG: SDR family NAD(P)-dependent oxidoreductase [Clostridium sp.]
MLESKTALVTGCNRGIGKEVIRVFAENNIKTIFAHARKSSKEFTDYIQYLENEYKVEVIPIYFDLKDSEAMKNEIKKIFSMKVNIDILVNNAGIAHGGLIQMTPISKIKDVFDVNFFSVVELTQLVVKIMKKYGSGSVINIASISGIDLKVGNCAYGTSKAALIAFTKTASSELSSLGIRVNAICPGLTDTDMAKLMETRAEEEMIKESSMKRLGNPQEIADLVCFLGSEKASFINGQAIRVDGGLN